MALSQFTLLSNTTLFKSKNVPSLSRKKSSCVPCDIQCKAASSIITSDQNNTSSLSANYLQPSIWAYDYIQSLHSDFMEKSYADEIDRLKEEVRVMLLKLENSMDQLELIDILQRLGVDRYFGLEISNIIESVHKKCKDRLKTNNNFYATALEFRLLRQHGYDVHQMYLKDFLIIRAAFIMTFRLISWGCFHCMKPHFFQWKVK
ncbi:hypothetical protein QN277_019008 [Acacia crassicarpa]|uniref:Terpene synthase N-terminal domain-containing protein n=1 Tax=Acacia crassicarpa TaxID=499986 RepID=A0AAE1KK99_9FABA|nr:hypothetical protein QN277_019008 [Acacia crassicarpa]